MINWIKLYFKENIDLLSEVSVIFVFKIFGSVLSFFVFFFLAKYYDSSGVGLYSLINSYLNIGTLLILMGLNTSILKIIPEIDIEKNIQKAIGKIYLFLLYTISNFILIIILYSIFIFIYTSLFERIELSLMIIVIPFIALINSLKEIIANGFRALMEMKLFSINLFAYPFLTLLIILLVNNVINLKLNITEIISLSVCLQFIIFICLFVSIKGGFSKRIIYWVKNFKEGYKNVLRVSYPMFISSGLFLITSQADIIILDIFVSKEKLGIYSLAVKYALSVNILITSVNTYISPVISRKFSQFGEKEAGIEVKKATKLIAAMTLPASIILIIVMPFIFNYHGPEFQNSYIPFLILMIGQLFNCISGPIGVYLNMTGKQKVVQKIMTYTTILNIALGFILMSQLGVLGASIVNAFTMILWNIIGILIIQNYDKFNISIFPDRLILLINKNKN